MTIKPKRKVIGSITGEVFETKGKTARRRLPDGRTETGKPLPASHPDYDNPVKIEKKNVEILVEEDEDLDWKKEDIIMDSMPSKPTGTIDIQDSPKPKIPKRTLPKTSKKDLDKMQDLFFAIGCAMDDKNYTGEEKALIVSKLFAGATDVRVETAELVMSARTYGLIAGCVAVAVLLKGSSGGLLSNYRRVLAGLNPQQTTLENAPDTLWDGK